MAAIPAECDRQAILHVHPTRHCNLACRHCYSSSGPGERASLDVDLLTAALVDAAGAGYSVVSFSGGEPMLYPSLPALLRKAKEIGFSTSVVTNGYAILSQRFLTMLPDIDTLVLSVDGPPDLHNAIRGRPDAFTVIDRATHFLGDKGRAFGIVHTVTQASWSFLDWLYEFARERGAALLQLHPLESAGRAALTNSDKALSYDDLLRLYVLGPLLEASCTRGPRVHVDVTHADLLATHPELFFDAAKDVTGPLTPLIIEEDGAVCPYVYGIDRRFMLGRLGMTSLIDIANGRRSAAAHGASTLCSHVRQYLLAAADERPAFNWYEELHRTSRHFSMATAVEDGGHPIIEARQHSRRDAPRTM